MLLPLIKNTGSFIVKFRTTRLVTLFIGLTATFWFLARVIPKPSRAAYPCQRAAFPIASAFILWITGSFVSRFFYKRARLASVNGKYTRAFLFSVVAVVIFTGTVVMLQIKDTVSAAIDFRTVSKQGANLYAYQMNEKTESIIEPEACVSIIRARKDNVTDLTYNDIDSMIRVAVNVAGGFDTLISEGDMVVIKPNVIAARAQNDSYANHFPEEANGIATDYRIIQAVVNLVRQKNSTGKIIMIEGSGYGLTRTNINALGYDNITGLDSIICLDENITQWYNTSSPNLVQVSLPEGQNLYTSANNMYYLHKLYYNADVVISLPCLKSHCLTGITGGVKNVGIGATPVEMYGNGTSVPTDDLPGRWNHIGHGDFSTQTVSLDKWIHDFYLCRPVDYVIMDGLQGAEYGPYPDGRTLSSVQKNMRLILAGSDALAVDAIEALIAGFDPYLVGHLALLAADNAGCINPAFIKVKGTQVVDIKTLFNEIAPGNLCRYNDYTNPSDVLLSSCTISNNEINLSLEINEEIAKVEIAYGDTVLNPIIIGDYSSITLPCPVENGDANRVNVFIYDKYLNSIVLSLENNSSLRNEKVQPLRLYPNPASSNVNLELPDQNSVDCIVTLYSNDGRLVFYKHLNGSNDFSLDITGISPGMYYVQVSSNGRFYQAKLNKN
jgi:uncharacterized protein (DUF362 family)